MPVMQFRVQARKESRMTDNKEPSDDEKIIARITNKDDPNQVIAIKYLREENAFVTSGIQAHFGEKEIMIITS